VRERQGVRERHRVCAWPHLRQEGILHAAPHRPRQYTVSRRLRQVHRSHRTSRRAFPTWVHLNGLALSNYWERKGMQ
jgi:hypothetical protein